MSSPISNSVQGHLTLALPMKSPADGQALRDKVPASCLPFPRQRTPWARCTTTA